MESNFIGDLFRDALFIVLLVVVVLIMPSLIVGLIVSTFQAATQINEQTLSFLPRLIVTLGAIMLAGPWMVNKVVEYTQFIFKELPFLIG